MNPVKASLRYPMVTAILTALAVGVGVNALLTMPRMEDPSITIRQGLVLAAYPGATSEQVEKQVTQKLEEHIFKFPEVRKQKTYSTSRPGLVFITVELEASVRDAPAFWAKLRHEMNETSAMELPKGVIGPLVNSDFGDTVAMLVAIHGRRYGYRELHDYADRIKDELRTVRNVGKLATYGEQTEEIRITSSLDRLSQYFADPLRVIQALQQRNIIQSSGSLDAGTAKVPLRTTGLFTTEDQIGSVLVDVSRTGQPVYIRDFADVERRYQDPAFLVRYDDEPSVLLSIEMQKGKNIVQLGDQLGEIFGRLKTILPPDIHLDLVANQPAVVKDRMASLGRQFLLAIGAVILVTIILLPLRVAVIAAVSIPVTICTSLGVLNTIGLQLHQVSIAAVIVVLGIVVDDAIVIADNYVDCLDRGIPRSEAAWQCVREVVVPVLTATADDYRLVSATVDADGFGGGIHSGTARDGGGGALGILHRRRSADASAVPVLHPEGAACPQIRPRSRTEAGNAGPAAGALQPDDRVLHASEVPRGGAGIGGGDRGSLALPAHPPAVLPFGRAQPVCDRPVDAARHAHRGHQ